MAELFSIIGSFVSALIVGALIGGYFSGGFCFFARNNFHVEWTYVALAFYAALIASLLSPIGMLLFGDNPYDLVAMALYEGVMPAHEDTFTPTLAGRILGCSVGFWLIWYRMKKLDF